MRYLSASNAHPPSPSMAISLELWRETGHIMFKTPAIPISYISVHGHKVSLGNYNILIGGMSSGEREKCGRIIFKIVDLQKLTMTTK